MTADHYFSTEPGVPEQSRYVQLEAAGRRLRMESSAGVFSATRVDAGTALLLRKAPPPTAQTTGNLLDLGCGYGPIALHMALSAPRATVYAVDVNRRALDLVRRNAQTHGATNIIAVPPEDVDPALTFGQIWSNPPIRIGKEELHTLLHRWIPLLGDHGTGWLVVARNLGSDSLQRWLTGNGWPAHRHASAKGYRVLRVDRHPDANPAP